MMSSRVDAPWRAWPQSMLLPQVSRGFLANAPCIASASAPAHHPECLGTRRSRTGSPHLWHGPCTM
jgi:hypothetical protein